MTCRLLLVGVWYRILCSVIKCVWGLPSTYVWPEYNQFDRATTLLFCYFWILWICRVLLIFLLENKPTALLKSSIKVVYLHPPRDVASIRPTICVYKLQLPCGSLTILLQNSSRCFPFLQPSESWCGYVIQDRLFSNFDFNNRFRAVSSLPQCYCHKHELYLKMAFNHFGGFVVIFNVNSLFLDILTSAITLCSLILMDVIAFFQELYWCATLEYSRYPIYNYDLRFLVWIMILPLAFFGIFDVSPNLASPCIDAFISVNNSLIPHMSFLALFSRYEILSLFLSFSFISPKIWYIWRVAKFNFILYWCIYVCVQFLDLAHVIVGFIF